MINTITTVITTSIVVGGAIGTILGGFYKTNKQANVDHENLRKEFEGKLADFKGEVKEALNKDHGDVKSEIKTLSEKIDKMAEQYVTIPSFKTYTDSMSQLLKMMNEKSTHIEVCIDDIRDEISNILKILTHNK